MTIVRDISFSLNKRDVLRGLGTGSSPTVRPQIDRLIDEMLKNKAALELIQPALAYDIHYVKKIDVEDCYLDNDTALHGTAIPKLFPKIRALAVAVATIGPELEARVIEYFKQGHRLKGLILDAMGNSSTENLRFAIRNIIGKEAAKRSLKTSSPVGPGGASWPLVEQFKLFKLVPADAIGVRLTETAMMIPIKSISMVMGLGENMPVWSAAERCDMCSLGQNCLYRYQPEPECENPLLEKSIISQ